MGLDLTGKEHGVPRTGHLPEGRGRAVTVRGRGTRLGGVRRGNERQTCGREKGSVRGPIGDEAGTGQ